jgi:hypothetical protein
LPSFFSPLASTQVSGLVITRLCPSAGSSGPGAGVPHGDFPEDRGTQLRGGAEDPIHRYGQNHTAQVYNLVLPDTIEGKIFLLLDEKLSEIARTLGKVDGQGKIAEDLRAQVLGQLSERLNYDRLYQEAFSDPELKRTRMELETALANAREARAVVFDLFQDLEGFSLDDYRPFSDVSTGMKPAAALSGRSGHGSRLACGRSRLEHL